MAKTFWDKYEVALLIESCLRIRAGEVSRATELYSLSEKLRRMATNKCIDIDDVYRNINGMRWQLGIIEAIFDGKEFESRQHPQLFVEMVQLYQYDKNKFDEILKEAHQMLATPINHVHKKEKTHTTKTVYEFELLDQKKSLAEIFDVDASLFCAVPVDSLDLSVRASNCLEKVKCFTVEQLLSYSVSQLQCVRNLGARSLDEIIKKVKAITSTSTTETHRASVLRRTTSKCKIDIPSNTEFGDKIEAILAGQPIEIANDEEKTVGEQINSAIDEVGVELCSTTYSNPKYGKTICDMLWDFACPEISRQQAWEIIVEKIKTLPITKRNVLALPYIHVYEVQSKHSLGIVKELCAPITTVDQIRFFKTHILASKNVSVCLGELPSFFDWVLTDFSAEMDSIIESLKSSLSQKTTMAIDILYERECGVTLGELGKKYGQTRESIRQKEKKASHKFWEFYKHQPNDLMLLIYLMRNGDSVLCFDEVKEIIGEFAYILWTALKNNPSHANFYFSKKANAVIIRQFNERTLIDEQLNVKIDALSNLFPTIVHESEKDALIERLSGEAGLPTEIVAVQFDGLYRRSGQFYHRGNLTITFMCDFVLEQEFRDGYKIASPEFAEEFKKQLNKYFGKDTSSTTNHAIDAKISEVGILIGRGKYIHPDYFEVPADVLWAINQYVIDSPQTRVSYVEIFCELQDIFAGTQIIDRYTLQGALQKYGCDFEIGKDYVNKSSSAAQRKVSAYSKDGDGVNLSLEIDEFLAQHDNGVVLQNVVDAFPETSKSKIIQALINCHSVKIADKYFSRNSVFDYDKMAEEMLQILLNQFKTQGDYTSAKLLYTEARSRLDDFLFYNSVFDSSVAIYDLARHLFEQELYQGYHFLFVDAIHIWKEMPDYPMNIQGLTQKYAREHGHTFSRQEIYDYYNWISNNKNPASTFGIMYYDSGHTAFLQYDLDKFVSVEALNITKAVLQTIDACIDNLLRDTNESRDYISAGEISEFFYTTLPPLGIAISWSQYLLEGVLSLHNSAYMVICPTDDKDIKTHFAAIVRKNSSFKTLGDIVWNEMNQEFQLPQEFTAIQFRQFLVQQGLIDSDNKMSGQKMVAGDLRFYWTDNNQKVTVSKGS